MISTWISRYIAESFMKNLAVHNNVCLFVYLKTTFLLCIIIFHLLNRWSYGACISMHVHTCASTFMHARACTCIYIVYLCFSFEFVNIMCKCMCMHKRACTCMHVHGDACTISPSMINLNN